VQFSITIFHGECIKTLPPLLGALARYFHCHIRQDHDKFLAAKTAGNVTRACLGAKFHRQRLEDHVVG
jgi:hypothetical protein